MSEAFNVTYLGASSVGRDQEVKFTAFENRLQQWVEFLNVEGTYHCLVRSISYLGAGIHPPGLVPKVVTASSAAPWEYKFQASSVFLLALRPRSKVMSSWPVTGWPSKTKKGTISNFAQRSRFWFMCASTPVRPPRADRRGS